MGIVERKLRERAAMKKLILDAAQDLYAEKGIEFTTIRKIADKIDYSPTTIYLYYSNKDMLFEDMRRLAYERLYERLQSAEFSDNPIVSLKSLGSTFIDFSFRNPEKYDLMFLMRFSEDNNETNQSSVAGLERILILVRAVINASIGAKKVVYTDALSAFLHSWSVLHGLTSLYLKGRISGVFGLSSQNSNAVYDAWSLYIESIRADRASFKEIS